MRTRLLSLLAAPVAIAVVLAAVTLAPHSAEALSSPTPTELEYLSWINGGRTGYGLRPVVLDGNLNAQAQLSAQRMATCSCIHHSPSGELGWFFRFGWRWLGENSAGGPNPWALNRAVVGSPQHLSNMLQPIARGVGVAVRQDRNGTWWVSELYGGF